MSEYNQEQQNILVSRIVHAILIEGPMPKIHRKAMRQLMKWPSLMAPIMLLVGDHTHNEPNCPICEVFN